MRQFQERKEEIKTLSTADLEKRLISHGFGELTDFAKAELISRKSEEETTRLARLEARDERALRLAEDANSIARQAKTIAVIAAVITMALTIITIIFRES